MEDFQTHVDEQKHQFDVFCQQNEGKWTLRWTLTAYEIEQVVECVQKDCSHQVLKPKWVGAFPTKEILSVYKQY